MTLYEFFNTYYPALCFFYLNAAIVAVLLPNRIFNTESINKHWILVFLVIAGLVGLRHEYVISLSLLGFMFSGVCVHYVREWQKNRVKGFQPIGVHDTTSPLYKRVK